MPLDAGRYPIRELLEAFRGASQLRPDLQLAFTGRRSATDDFLVWNYLDEHTLVSKVDFLPYYGHCAEFPAKKQECALWIGRDTPAAELTAEALLRQLDTRCGGHRKIALFITSFHPAKHEGNSALMRQWLDHLRAAGYRLHVVYYGLDRTSVTEEMRRAMRRDYDLAVEVDVTTRLVGSNRNGLNVHVDDWCGFELLDAVGKLTTEFEYDVALVNYAFMSAVLERIAAYTRKILLTHDSFADRNRRMLTQGFPESGWISLDQRGEALAVRRADVVVALQEDEAAYFRQLAGPGGDVRVIGPIPNTPHARRPPAAAKLRIGYFGSSNSVNEYNLVAYLTEWAQHPDLVTNSALVLAGGICATLPRFASAELLEKVSPRLLGPVDQLHEFFEKCDLCINPERGGTGIKIKTLDAMAHGAAVLTTAPGAVGIESASRFHNAPDVAALARLTAELEADRGLIELAWRETREAYTAYKARHDHGLTELLGPPVRTAPARAPVHADERAEMVVPDYVRQTASPYHLEEFRKVFSRVDLRGKSVLEIGSDFHLASARLFAANGAAEVVANNLWEWRSPEPLPPNVTFRAGDISDVALPDHSFDVVYGVAVLEHIPDVGRVAQAVKRILHPGGVAYLQGCPVWTGALGHHVWLDAHQTAETEGVAWEANEAWSETVYSFADPAKNPIPHWAHLTHTPAELREMLMAKDVPSVDAERIVRFVYNLDGRMTGACSNFKAPSEILDGFREHFAVECEPILHSEPENAEFRKASERYSESDLTTLGLQLWLTDRNQQPAHRFSAAVPVVSIVAPFYNVEEYIEECLASILAQDLPDFEVILVDDGSTDESRTIAARFAAGDGRIRIVTHAENRGLGPARNTGVRYARGDYILFLDCDDLLSGPGALGRLVEAAEETGCRVVIGSCERLKPDGTVVEFDRLFDRQGNGKPGSIKEGLDAFLGGFDVPGWEHLPLRAWGSLIQRAYYEELGLDYPAGEHEDMPHTPFLYYRAGGVYYDPHVAVLYRERSNSLSTAAWSAAKLRRYGTLWQEMKRRMHAHGLQDQVGEVAAVFACHLIWRIETNGSTGDAGETPADVLQEIMADLAGAASRALLFGILDRMPKHPWNATCSLARYQAMTASLPDLVMVEFHRTKLGLSDLPSPTDTEPEAAPAAAPVAGSAAPVAAREQRSGGFLANAGCEAEIVAAYEADASARLKNFPSMLTLGDKALYFHAARNLRFRGTIVDGGCFVGGTTLSLVEGLSHNPMVRSGDADTRGLIRVYDLFTVDDDYILRHLQQNYPDREFRPQTSFLPVFEENLRDKKEMLQVRPGDVTAIGYADSQPIELFGVDFCKALPVTDFTVRAFFPHLMTGALVLQQDFVHEYHPHIHLSMLRLADHFETRVELKWGGTVAYTCIKQITPAVIRERFGTDSSWFSDAAANVPLLRRLIEECHYDENRWVFLLTLGMYHLAQGHPGDARAAYYEARERFPQFTPSELTRQMIWD
jgi:SAM-dependent methyltransferase